jgi:tyrosyl-tRNA synthetase
MNDLDEFLTRGVANIIPSKEELRKLLESGKKLNVYLGIDPTSTKIHLGHTVPLRTLNRLAELGHNVTFLIGDFTALIGDTSDKESERPVLTSKEIENNFKDYKRQAEKVLDFSKVKIRYNSEWLKELKFEEVVKLCHHFSGNDFISRELVKKRLSEGKRIGLHEFLYPVMQGYDSYFMDTDIQVGGTDQTFNMQAGRTLQKDLRHKESFVLATTLLIGSDGKKMSKTQGNVIWLDDNPNDMFRKAMAINDGLIVDYFTLATNLPLTEVKKFEEELKGQTNPINVKKKLARQIVKELYDENAADMAQKEFERTIQNKEQPQNLESFPVGIDMNVAGTISAWGNISASEVKRLVRQGGIEINGEKIGSSALNQKVQEGSVIKVGRKNPFKVKIK